MAHLLAERVEENTLMKPSIRCACSVFAIALAAVAARAGEVTVNLSALANEPWAYVGPNDFLIINETRFRPEPRTSEASRLRFHPALITTGPAPREQISAPAR